MQGQEKGLTWELKSVRRGLFFLRGYKGTPLGGPVVVFADSIEADGRGYHVLLVHQVVVEEVTRFQKVLQ